ncbi:unnamed protein product, partial [Phaeothamnion confervicola]
LVLCAIVGTLLAFVVHEYAHGAMAYQLGDPTPKYEGRLTLNPIVHLHPVGSLMLVASIISSGGNWVIGFAKPVRFDYDNLKNPFFDGGLIAFAGPLSNFIICFVLGIITQLAAPPALIKPLAIVIAANLGFGLFNCFPFPALDGWKMLQAIVPKSFAQTLRDVEQKTGVYGIIILLVASYFLIDPIFKPLFREAMQLLVGQWPLR